MTNTVRRAVVIGLLVLCAGCGSEGPTSPTNPPQSVAVALPAPAPATTFPALSGPSRTFVFSRELSHPVSDYTKFSYFVLYDNGAFVLHYRNLTGSGYRGVYKDKDGVVTFEWEGGSAAGPWGATGTLKGDSLTVRYNLIMQLTDFEDAVYTLTP